MFYAILDCRFKDNYWQKYGNFLEFACFESVFLYCHLMMCLYVLSSGRIIEHSYEYLFIDSEVMTTSVELLIDLSLFTKVHVCFLFMVSLIDIGFSGVF